MINQEEIRLNDFFGKLTKVLENELKQSSLQSYSVINKYSKIKIKNVTVEYVVRLANLQMNIRVEFETNYHNKGPSVYVEESFSSPIIDKGTKAINYSSFFIWNEKARLVELLKAIEKYFKDKPPINDPKFAEKDRIFTDVRTLSSKFTSNFNLKAFESKLDNQDRKDLYDATKNCKIIWKCNELTEIKKLILNLVDKMLDVREEITHKEATILSLKESISPLLSTYNTKKDQYQILLSKLNSQSDRFSTAQITIFVEKLKEERMREVDLLKKRIKEEKLTSSESIEKLCTKSKELVYYTNLRNKLINSLAYL